MLKEFTDLKKLLALLLLTPLVSGEELPEKLFCDVGSISIQLEFNNKSGEHFVTYTSTSGNMMVMKNPEEVKVKIKRLRVSPKYLYFVQRVPLPENSLHISVNRKTGGIASNFGDGKCATSEEDLIRYKF